MFDFNDAEEQSGYGELIPANTIAKVNLYIRPGGIGAGGYLTQSKSSDAQYLDCELTVLEGPFARRKIWTNMTVVGGRKGQDGESIAAKISKATIRAMLESARNIQPSDSSPAAYEKRKIGGWEDLNGMEFTIKIGIEKDKTGFYSDKNKIQAVVTPGMKDYLGGGGGYTPAPKAAEQSLPYTPAAAAKPAAASTNVPLWAM